MNAQEMLLSIEEISRGFNVFYNRFIPLTFCDYTLKMSEKKLVIEQGKKTFTFLESRVKYSEELLDVSEFESDIAKIYDNVLSEQRKNRPMFSNIPRMTQTPTYHVNVGLRDLKRTIEHYISDYSLILNPDFQRGNVWTEAQKISYLEFLLRGGKTGLAVYFNNPSWSGAIVDNYNDFVCVDGLQRITAIIDFFENKYPVFGHYFEEYADKLSFTDFMLDVYVNDLKTKKEVLNWYVEMNTGGTVHSPEEIERVRKMMEEV